jgi:hypothetical protein
MAQSDTVLGAFNRGRISPLALARIDFKRTALSAEVQTNWLPRALGSMSLRPGLEYTGATKSNLASVTIPFIKATDDTARLEMTNLVMRVWVDDELVTRETVTSAITNGTFGSDIASWSDQDGGSSVSAWASGGYMSLIGTTTAAAKRRQQVTCSGGNIGVRHALNIVIARGPVLIRVGSTAGGDDYIAETTLETGYHSLAFTPSGDFHIDLFNYTEAASLVDSIAVASSGAMEITAPWLAADLGALRWDQSGDVVFVACYGYRQRRIERRAVDSWSIVEYKSDDGPFMVQNTGPITLTPGLTSGDTTLTASAPLFKSTQVGTLFKLVQSGQSQDVSVTAEDQWSDPIRVTGVDGARVFAVFISGTWSATVTLQYSPSEPGSWADAQSGSFTANTAISYDDTLDNQVIYYRIGVKAGGYVSGTVEAQLVYTSGSQTGICRVTDYNSSTSVTVAILSEFSSTAGTSDWSESYWSERRGFPSSVAFYEGRLWWAGKDRKWGSIPDNFHSFDDETEGDSGPINRSIGSGPVDKIHWLLPLQRLVSGADGAIRSARSTSFDEPLTPTNFNLKDVSTQGASAQGAVKMDTSGVFVQRGGAGVFEIAYDPGSYDYVVNELTQLVPEIGEPGIAKIVVQHQPEKRFHCIRTDGTVAVLCYDKQEEVTAWIDYETDGEVEDAVVLPGDDEDAVYYTVARTVGGGTVRYHEKLAREDECRGFPEAKLADSFVEYSGSATTTITGLSTLEGKEVVCWGWNTATPFTNGEDEAIGRDFGTFTVSSGAISGLSDAVTNAIVGLGYSARYKSTKLGEALTQKKRIVNMGLIAKWVHASGLTYGTSFDELDDLPQVERGVEVDEHDIRSDYDEVPMSIPGEWTSDARLCLEANAPRPVTVLAAVLELE